MALIKLAYLFFSLRGDGSQRDFRKFLAMTDMILAVHWRAIHFPGASPEQEILWSTKSLHYPGFIETPHFGEDRRSSPCGSLAQLDYLVRKSVDNSSIPV